MSPDGVSFSSPFFNPNTTEFPFPEPYPVVTINDTSATYPEIRLQLRGVVGADVQVRSR